MAPGALVCVCSWRGQRSAAPPRVAMLHVSPRHCIFRPAAIRRRAARHGRAGGADPPAEGAAAGTPSDAFSRDETPGRFGGVFALVPYCVRASQRGGKAA